MRKSSGSGAHAKWAELIDQLTIAGHTQHTATELYTEITDRLPLLTDVS